METNQILKKLTKLQKKMPDLIIKKIDSGLFKYLYIVTIETVSSSDKINDFILKYFSQKNKSIDFIPSINQKEVKDFDNLLYLLFCGYTIVIDGKNFYAFETKANIDRGVNEPTSEPVTRGPKDSFNENYNTNLGLIRRRIKSENLVIKDFIVGRETKNKVSIIYMDNICDKKVVDKLSKDIENIDIDGVFDTNYIRELIKNKNYTFFPTLINSEKPDDTSKALIDGKIVLMSENSPDIILLPTFFIDFFHTGEDYYRKPFYVSFVRIIRILSFFTSICLPAFFLSLITYNQEIIPTNLLINFAAQRSKVPFPALIELTLLLFIFEIIYEGDARTPSSRGTSLSILGALVLGDAAVNAGLISPIMVIVVAISSMSSLITIFQEMQSSIRFWRYLLMIFVTFFGIVGFYVGCTMLIINLCTVESYGKPYLLPFAPFDLKAQSNALIRRKLSNIKYRKSYLTKKNIVRKG